MTPTPAEFNDENNLEMWLHEAEHVLDMPVTDDPWKRNWTSGDFPEYIALLIDLHGFKEIKPRYKAKERLNGVRAIFTETRRMLSMPSKWSNDKLPEWTRRWLIKGPKASTKL